MKLNSNVLTFEHTNRLKGLLILLIVFGHISQIFHIYDGLQSTLYSFHVVSFLLLPFLFNHDQLTFKNIKKNLWRIYFPYTLFFLLSFVAYSILEHQFNPLSALTSWAIGTSAFLKLDTGFRIFWFFPALMSTVLLIMLFNTLSKKFKKAFMLILILGHFIIPFIPRSYLFYFPLSLYIPIYLFIIGISVQYIYKHFNYHQYSIGFSILFIFLLYLDFGSNFSLATAILPNIINSPVNFILQDMIMITSFFALIAWSKNIKFFELFGKYSLAIFTIHPFVIQALELFYKWTTVAEGFIKFLLVISITLFITKIIYYFKINNFIYK